MYFKEIFLKTAQFYTKALQRIIQILLIFFFPFESLVGNATALNLLHTSLFFFIILTSLELELPTLS